MNGSELKRAQALSDIAKATSLSEVFEVANNAFKERHNWGDELTSCVVSYSRWCASVFPVEAIEGGANIGIRKASREDLLSQSLQSAKKMCTTLLVPMPATDDKGQMLSDESLRKRWVDVANKIKKELDSFWLDSLNLFAHQTNGREALCAQPEGEWEKALHIKDWNVFCKKVDFPQNKSFELMERYGGKSERQSLEALWDGASVQESNFSELLKVSGASYIKVSPAGGIKIALKGAAVLKTAFEDLARHVGFKDSAVLSVGLEGLLLSPRYNGSGAAFTPKHWLMEFSSCPRFLAHEWTHLLDHAIENRGSPEQKKALKELKESSWKVAPDPSLVKQREIMIAQMHMIQREILGDFLNEKGHAEAKLRHLSVCDESGVPICSESFHKDAIWFSKKNFSVFNHFLMQNKIPSARLDECTVEWVWRDMRATSIFQEDLQLCNFIKWAKFHDTKAGINKNDYFSSKSEVIARIAESHFVQVGALPSVANSKDGEVDFSDKIIPMGTEAKELSKSYRALLDAFVANPLPLLNERVRQAVSLERVEESPQFKSCSNSKPQDAGILPSLKSSLERRRTTDLKHEYSSLKR